MDRRKLAFDPAEVLAVVEVLSPSSVGHDQITKRRFYGHVGIRHYWVVDPPNRTLTVLRHNGAGYDEVAVVKPGTTWRTDDPFPLALDPADFT
jgi:Uma2 family endonuclease